MRAVPRMISQTRKEALAVAAGQACATALQAIIQSAFIKDAETLSWVARSRSKERPKKWGPGLGGKPGPCDRSGALGGGEGRRTLPAKRIRLT